jgi:hypothetical protein
LEIRGWLSMSRAFSTKQVGSIGGSITGADAPEPAVLGGLLADNRLPTPSLDRPSPLTYSDAVKTFQQNLAGLKCGESVAVSLREGYFYVTPGADTSYCGGVQVVVTKGLGPEQSTTLRPQTYFVQLLEESPDKQCQVALRPINSSSESKIGSIRGGAKDGTVRMDLVEENSQQLVFTGWLKQATERGHKEVFVKSLPFTIGTEERPAADPAKFVVPLAGPVTPQNRQHFQVIMEQVLAKAKATGRQVTFGREPGGARDEIALVVDFSEISRRHGQIAWNDGVWAIRDLKSKNGIYVSTGGAPFRRIHEPTILRPDDCVRLPVGGIPVLMFRVPVSPLSAGS